MVKMWFKQILSYYLKKNNYVEKKLKISMKFQENQTTNTCKE